MLAAEEWRQYEESYEESYGEESPERKPAPSGTTLKKHPSSDKIQIAKRRKQSRLIALTIVLMMGICGVFLVCVNAWQTEINYQIFQLKQEKQELASQIDNLNVSLNSGSQLGDIETYAKGSLGMSYPSQEQYVYVNDLKGTSEVNRYVSALASEQRGLDVKKDTTPAQAAKHLFS